MVRRAGELFGAQPIRVDEPQTLRNWKDNELMFKGLANLGSLLKQAQQIGGQMDKLAEELKNRRATGTAGGGMVEVEVNGLLEVLRCRIDPQLVAQGDRELIEDLVVAAVNQAIGQGASSCTPTAMQGTDRRPGACPGLEEALEKLGGELTEEAESPTAPSRTTCQTGTWNRPCPNSPDRSPS